MVDGGELPKKLPQSRPSLCKVLRDTKSGDLHFIVNEERVSPKEGGISPRINVWWSREPRKTVGGRAILQEHIVIRQEKGGSAADVIFCTHGQAYDLIDALSKAVESR